MVRKLVYAALTATPTPGNIPAVRWISAGALDAPPPRPFAVLRLRDGPASDVRSLQPTLEVWIHDERGSYTRIDDILEQVKQKLSAATPMENATHRIVDVRWIGDSPDLVDEGYNTNTKWTSFTLTGRK